jgi:chromate transporter
MLQTGEAQMTYLKLVMSFLKVGLFGIGGGYAMLPLIEHEVTSVHGWLSHEEFVDVVAIAEVTPGPIGLNMSTYTGYKVKGFSGSVAATVSNVFPTFLLALIASRLFFRFRGSQDVANFFKGLRPVAIGLIAAAGISMGKVSIVDYRSAIILLVVFLCGFRFKLHPILLIVLSALAGIILY